VQPLAGSRSGSYPAEIIVCLGATAAQSILGNAFRLTQERGKFVTTWAHRVTATVHPSAIPRAPDEQQRDEDRKVKF